MVIETMNILLTPLLIILFESAINLLSRIHSTYDVDTAGELERRFINSIKSNDPRKFRRSMQRIIESKKNDNS